jgi:6-phosphogluconolactonase
MQVQVFPDLEALSHEAATLFVNLSRNSTVSQGRFTVVLSGGSTPRILYSLLGSDLYRRKVDWHHVHFFWADERCVPVVHEESNFKLVFDLLLSKISLPQGNIHRIKVEEGPEKGAQDYEDCIREFFKVSGFPVFDLIILGVGKDGHTASLFPGSLSLEEKTRLAIPVYMEEIKRHRITLTLPVLNNADHIVFLAAGPAKADAIKEILENRKEQYPAGLVSPVHGNLIWMLDREASSKLGTPF